MGNSGQTKTYETDMSESFKIEEGVPLPKANSGRRFRYPWGNLKKVGQSVLVNTDNPVSARSAALSFARKHQMRLETRMTPEGLRVWRTA